MTFIYLLLLGGIYVGWNIGANDTANYIGTTVGAVAGTGLVKGARPINKRTALTISLDGF